MDNIEHTQKFTVKNEEMSVSIRQLLTFVYQALEEKGYHPINQLVGYLISGEPAYIPRHNNARNLIRKVERDEIIEELVRFYLKAGKIDPKQGSPE
ncbi:conserved hypothetical protein [[Clostridium] ultunense Esp]|uniref:IreB family regulatory phosphoprotein n=1 Tax=Thermicanus aegyptius TaxID=94009 RepID=UPI0002B70D1C|nr:IreB family regulatory phosphoprotein [Thermicanus aegyptius]MBE3554927.1 IreB family regulatory phosphoprotein [Thermicanus sp.]CCQ93309.1 conserved hypothetical protein [[Clostridium] ultunense Esp]